jgi:hypothetical protein
MGPRRDPWCWRSPLRPVAWASMAVFEALGATPSPVDHWVFAAIFTELERPVDAEDSDGLPSPIDDAHS